MTHTIIVRRYGVPPIGFRRPQHDWDSAAEAEMARCTKLWNKLVGIEREHRVEYRLITASPEVVAVQAQIDGLMQRRATLIAERAAKRKKSRKRTKTPELDTVIAAIGAELKTAVTRAKELRHAARDANRPALTALDERRKAAVKTARRESGLYWCNYNAVVASYDRGRQAALARGGELRERESNYDRITNQIQGGMTVAKLMSGTHSQVRIEPDPTGDKFHLLSVTVCTGRDANGKHTRHMVSWPIRLHRDFPEHARIQEVVVVREKVVGVWRWSAVFTCRVPTLPSTDRREACGIDIGWRQMDHGVRVAMLASAAGVEEIQLPQALVDRLMKYYDLGSKRHQARNDMLERLSVLDWSPAPELLRKRAGEVLAKRDEGGNPAASGLDLRGLAAEWTRTGEQFMPELCNEMTAWAETDRHLWLTAYGRHRAMLARREFYRITAKRIIEQHGVVGLEKVDWAKLGSEAKTKLPLLARRMRVVAATSELLGAIKSAAKREGVRIHEHGGKSSFVCHACGHETAVNDRGQLHYTCGHCSAVHDQDVNAAYNLLASARASKVSMPVVEGTSVPLPWQRRLEGKRRRQEEKRDEVETPPDAP